MKASAQIGALLCAITSFSKVWRRESCLPGKVLNLMEIKQSYLNSQKQTYSISSIRPPITATFEALLIQQKTEIGSLGFSVRIYGQ